MSIKVTLVTLNKQGKEIELESRIFHSDDELQAFLKQPEHNTKTNPEIHDIYMEYLMG